VFYQKAPGEPRKKSMMPLDTPLLYGYNTA